MHALCPPPAPSKKLRWVAVATPIGEPALREELFLGDPPEGERLELTLDSSDLDGDRRDDLVVHVALEGAPRPFEAGARTVADLRWLDRPTGLSRDAEEPEASLRRAASALATRATKKGDAAGVPAGARASSGSMPGSAPMAAILWSPPRAARFVAAPAAHSKTPCSRALGRRSPWEMSHAR